MSYVVYEIDSTLLLHRLSKECKREYFETKPAASAALTRACKKDANLDRSHFSIAERPHFFQCIEKKETKINLLSGLPFEQGVNTHICCDPSSETFWSM